MANQKISQLPNDPTPQGVDLVPIVNTGAGQTQQSTLAQFFNILASIFRIKDDSDNTKQIAFDASGISTGTVRTLKAPDASDTIAVLVTPQTLSNKTLSTGTKVNTTGSDAPGSMYYTDAAGLLQPISGTPGQIISLNGSNIPQFIPNPAASNGSTAVKGVFQEATAAQITAGTATGSTGAALAITPDQLKLSAPTFNGSNLTNLPFPFLGLFANGSTTKNAADSSATQTIPHGLGVVPKNVKIAAALSGGTSIGLLAQTVYNGTTQSSFSNMGFTSNYYSTQTFQIGIDGNTVYSIGVVTFDATNIYIAWTNVGGAHGVFNIVWEAQA